MRLIRLCGESVAAIRFNGLSSANVGATALPLARSVAERRFNGLSSANVGATGKPEYPSAEKLTFQRPLIGQRRCDSREFI